MPMTKKGEKIMRAMMETYGKKKGKKVFYASKNKGKIVGVEKHGSPMYHDFPEAKRVTNEPRVQYDTVAKDRFSF